MLLRVPGVPGAARRRLARSLTYAELAAGRVPSGLTSGFAAELAVADDRLARGDRERATRVLARAMPMAFHRVLHFDRLASPLAEDPGRFLAPIHASAAIRAMTSGTRSRPAAGPPAGRPLRLLLVTRANANFLAEIRHRYESDPRTEVRFLDLAADPARAPLANRPEPLIRHLLTGGSAYGDAVAAWLGPHLDWADTVFVDWCVSPAAMITMLDPGDTRIVVRLHSFELFTMWPHLVDFGRVDDLILVSDHMRDLTTAVVPRLRAGTTRLAVIPNAVDLHPYLRPKPAAARFTLGLVGLGSVAKDPLWAFEVVRRLRERDSRYQLLLIGQGLDPAASAAVADYHARFEHELAELAAAGAVRRLGHTPDVPAALTGVGVILSSSVRESFHRALVEGAASGAVPVVRDWPFFAGTGTGARGLFPPDWVVGSPEQAADRIRQMTASEAGWREAGARASAHARATWDWSVTQRAFDQLLLGPAVRPA